jgi:hypothetical protein
MGYLLLTNIQNMNLNIILSCVWVTVDRSQIRNWNYWTLTECNSTLQITAKQRLVLISLPLYSLTDLNSVLNSVGRVLQPQSRPAENAACNTSSIVVWCLLIFDVFLCWLCTGYYLATNLCAIILLCSDNWHAEFCKIMLSPTMGWMLNNM